MGLGTGVSDFRFRVSGFGFRFGAPARLPAKWARVESSDVGLGVSSRLMSRAAPFAEELRMQMCV
jgi:hypothetical protein